MSLLQGSQKINFAIIQETPVVKIERSKATLSAGARELLNFGIPEEQVKEARLMINVEGDDIFFIVTPTSDNEYFSFEGEEYEIKASKKKAIAAKISLSKIVENHVDQKYVLEEINSTTLFPNYRTFKLVATDKTIRELIDEARNKLTVEDTEVEQRPQQGTQETEDTVTNVEVGEVNNTNE